MAALLQPHQQAVAAAAVMATTPELVEVILRGRETLVATARDIQITQVPAVVVQERLVLMEQRKSVDLVVLVQ